MKKAEEINTDLGIDAVTWRLRFAILTRLFLSRDRYAWLESLQLKQCDINVIAQAAELSSVITDRVVTPMPRSALPLLFGS